MNQHNPADVLFAQAMVPHHAAAIEMSSMLLRKADVHPGTADFARRTIESQTPQMQQLTEQLAEWGREPLQPDPGRTLDQEALDAATGSAAVLLFLQLMTQHHKSALLLAQAESDNGDFPPFVTMARQIIASQGEEIGTMADLAREAQQ